PTSRPQAAQPACFSFGNSGPMRCAAARIVAPKSFTTSRLANPSRATNSSGRFTASMTSMRVICETAHYQKGVTLSCLAVGEPQLVIADMEDVALVDALVVDAHALVVDAVRRPEVLDVEHPVAADDRGVLARDVAVLDGQIRRLGAAPDDELI